MRLVRFRPAALSVLAAAVVSTGLAAPAQALSVTPSTRTFTAAIDAPATWERESGCSQTEKKGPRTLRRLLDATYGARSSNILRACSAAHSGHEEGRALDWMVNARVPEELALGDAFMTWLAAPDEFGNPAAMARRLGIQYVIWNNGMWRPSTGLTTEYGGCTARTKRFKRYDNTCHRNHVHVSFSWAGALGRTSFYTGFVACPAPLTSPWVPVVVPASTEVVPVAPTRVLRSKSGLGLPAGPCRVRPDVRVDVPVRASGVVPPEAAAVTLRVTATKIDAPAELRVWTAGTLPPSEAQASGARKAKAVAEVTVPVGPDGLVSLQLAGGMAHVTAEVVGWSVAAPPPQLPPLAPVPVQPAT